jgi:hypothetical protein
MLTTIDNPFNPFTHWDEWKRYDEDKKYFTCAYLARIAKTSHELSVEDYKKAIEDAINEIVSLNINGMYAKVYEDENIDNPGGGD